MFEILTLRIRNLFRGRVVDEELDDELRFHLEKQTEEFVRHGLPEPVAAKLARRQFGNVLLHKEECRDRRKLAWLEGVAQDLRHSVKTLRRSPGFTSVSILTLALGIGATSAMYSVIDRAVLHPVVAPEPGRLVWLQESSKAHSESGSNPQRLADWQTARSFSAVAGTYSEGLVWASTDGPVRLTALRSFGDLFGVLRPELQMGRPFTAAEMNGRGPAVALLTAKSFQRKFQGNAGVLHQTIRLEGMPYQVVGVLSARSNYPEDMDLWTPARIEAPSRAAGFLGLLARLTPGASIRQAQAEINVLSERLARQYPATDAGRSVQAMPLVEHVASEVRTPLLVLFGVVASVLLIGCLNIAGLLLARGLTRRREAAIRVSVGAGYGRLARLFFTESLLLSLAGCVAGLIVAFGGVAVLKTVLASYVPGIDSIAVNGPVVLCGVALALLAAAIFGGLPAWQFASTAQTTALKEGGAGTAAVSKSRLRSGLILGEVALSVVSLTMAALLANSFLKLMNRPLGFNAAHAYTFALNLSWDTKPALIHSLSGDTLAKLNTLPGTIACGVADRLPAQGGSQSGPLLVKGRTLEGDIAEREFGFRTASAGFFGAAGIPLMAGHVYHEGKGVKETIISQRLAQLLFAGQDPIGQQIAQRPSKNGQGAAEPEWLRIVGVVGSVPTELLSSEPTAELYVPWGTTYWPLLNFVVRTERPLGDVSGFVRREIQAKSGEQIFTPLTTMDESLAEARATPRLGMILVSSFAGVALALSALGIFGLMAQETDRRRQEIGVRLALGAEPQRIALDAVLRAVKLVTAGLVVGLGGAWFASGFVKSLLFEVAPHDVESYAVAAAVLLGAGILASLWPALRAARIDPIRALRHE